MTALDSMVTHGAIPAPGQHAAFFTDAVLSSRESPADREITAIYNHGVKAKFRAQA
jgi:hypothetical protein